MLCSGIGEIMPQLEKRSAQEDVKLSFDKAAESLGIQAGIRQMFCEPWRELRVSLPVRMDNGDIEVTCLMSDFSFTKVLHDAISSCQAKCTTTRENQSMNSLDRVNWIE